MANQPPFAEYPRPSEPAIAYSGRGPGVYFDAISESWNYVRRDMGTWVGGILLMLVITYAMLIPIAIVTRPALGTTPSAGAYGLQFVLNLVPGIVSQMLLAGLIGMGVRQLRGESISVGTMFDPFRRFGPNFLACLLYMAAVYASLLACVLPAFFFVPVLALMPTVALLKEVSPGEAFKMTFEACKKYWAGLFGLLFITGIVASLGVCACGIGILFTYPILILVLAIHYRAFFESNPAQSYGTPPATY